MRLEPVLAGFGAAVIEMPRSAPVPACGSPDTAMPPIPVMAKSEVEPKLVLNCETTAPVAMLSRYTIPVPWSAVQNVTPSGSKFRLKNTAPAAPGIV